MKTLVKELQADAIAAYEDLVWKLAQVKDKEVRDLASPAEYGQVLFAAEKTIKQFVADVQDLRRRIALQDEIKESNAAKEKLAELQEKRAKVDMEFESIQQQFQVRYSTIDADIASEKRRIANTSDARSHYYKSSPAWLKKEMKSVGSRLLQIKAALGNRAMPGKPADISDGLVRIPVGPERDAYAARHAEETARHARLIEQYAEEEQELHEELELLEQQRDALTRASMLLRPTPEDVK